MLGTILGLAWAFGYVSAAIKGTWDYTGGGRLLLGGLILSVVALLVGLLFRKTIGIGLMFAMGGAVIAAFIEFAHGHASLGGTFLLHAVMFWVVQHLLADTGLAAVDGWIVRRQTRRDRKKNGGVFQGRLHSSAALHGTAQEWNDDGTHVADPPDLVPGVVYGIKGALCVYRGVFHGPRWQGLARSAPGDEVGDWWMFEQAVSTGEDAANASVRVGADGFGPDGVVVSLPVGQDVARELFDAIRTHYLRWQAKHPGEPLRISR